MTEAWLGGSSVRGGNGQLPTHLEAAQLLPTLVDVESLNFAAPGLDSSHHVAMLPEVLGLEPDVLVVYSGHNDLGNVSFQTRFSDPRTVWTMRVRSWLSHSRLFELLDVRVTDLSADRVPPPEAPKVAFDEARRAAAHASYEQSLRWIVRAARSEEVEVVLLTPISNPIAPPVVWACSELHELPDPPMRTRPHHIPPEVPDEACADHAWMRGMNALKTDDVQAAGAHFQAARDLDPTPLRADARMTEIVRRVAKEEGAVLIDTQQRAVEQGGGMEPPEFFQDPVHFTAEGHRFVADAVAETLEARL